MVRINGVQEDAAGMTVARLLESRGFDAARVAVERNGQIVPKARYGEAALCDGDSVEVVSFVGGG